MSTLLNVIMLITLSIGQNCNEETCESSDFDNNSSPTEFRPIEPPKYVEDENAQYWVTFINECGTTIDIFWLNSPDERYQGTIEPNQQTQIGTFIGHQFFYRLKGETQKDPNNRLQITTMKRGITNIYFKHPETMRAEQIKSDEDTQQFKAEYFNKTGKHWIAYYPRDPPKLFMFPADKIGQKHAISSNHSYYSCYPATASQIDHDLCQKKETLHFEWIIKATSPKVMWLEPRLLSDFEIEHLIQIASKTLNRSTVGQGENIQVSYSRTSKGAWIQRTESEVVDTIFKRIGDVTNIPETHLWPSYGCEQLQILKYDVGEQFFPHPDYNTEKKGMRYMTLVMYLNEVEEGGETEFPKINLKVTPKKGHVIGFYNQLPDGNADDQSLHAGLPPTKGIKWAASLWIWDPYFER